MLKFSLKINVSGKINISTLPKQQVDYGIPASHVTPASVSRQGDVKLYTAVLTHKTHSNRNGVEIHLRSLKPKNLLSPIPREPFSCLIFPHTNYPLLNRLYLCKTINKTIKIQRGKQLHMLSARAFMELD